MTLSNPAQYISGRTVQEQMNSLIDYVDQRAADVALDAIASDVAQVHQDMLDADADASAAAASAAAAAGTLANAVKKTGEASQSIEGDVSLSTGDLSVAGDAAVQGQLSVIGGCDLRAPVKIPVTPTNNDDAASKKYVDDSLAGYAPMVRTTGNQTIDGDKTFNNLIGGRIKKQFTSFGSNDWTLLYKRDNSGRSQHLLGYASQSFIFALISSDSVAYTRVFTSTSRQYNQPIIKITKDSDGVVCVWCRGLYSATINWHLLENAQYSTEYVTGITPVNIVYAMPVVGQTTGYNPSATYTEVYDSDDFPFIR